ncbi:MAG: nucleoside triphosphate pyrophosphohydrolase family protein [Nitrososphaera sp.]
MNFAEYQEKAISTAFYTDGVKVMYPALGLAGEVGEVCNKIKKIFRDNDGEVTIDMRLKLHKELGDALWYMAALANDLELSLQAIAEDNLSKLAGRKERGTLHGSGDDR